MTEKKAAIYARVSTQAQGEDDKASIPEQLTSMERYCEEKGYKIVGNYVDIGQSGATKNRPKFLQMLNDAKEQKFDCILCWKTDRLSRGMYPAAALLETVEPLDISVEAVTEAVDMNTFGLLAAVGKIELDNIRDRTRFGREKRARDKHLVPGGNKIPYGYKLTDGRIEIDKNEAQWIWHLFNWVAQGKSARSWTCYANTSGFVSRYMSQGVTAQQISVWLRNPIYKGEYHWNKRTRKAGKLRRRDNDIVISCPAIVSLELWQTVQNRLAKNKSWSKGNTKNFYLLQKLMRCKECDKSFICGSNTSGRFYQCQGTRLYPHRYQCRKPYTIKADLLEEYVWNEVMDKVDVLVSQDDIMKRLMDGFEEQKSRLAKDLKIQREAIEDCNWQRQLIATRERQRYLKPKDSKLQYAAINAEEERHLEEIRKLEGIADQNNSGVIDELVERLSWVQQEFNDFNLKPMADISNIEKRNFLRQIVDKIIIDKNNDVEVRIKLEPKTAEKVTDSIVNISMHNTT